MYSDKCMHGKYLESFIQTLCIAPLGTGLEDRDSLCAYTFYREDLSNVNMRECDTKNLTAL